MIATKPILIQQLRPEDATFDSEYTCFLKYGGLRSEEFASRIDTYRHHGYFKPHEANTFKKRVSQKPAPYAQAILRRFVERYFYLR